MKNSLVILCLVLFVSPSSFATYRSEFQGQTSIEREIQWAWRYIPEFLISCKESGSECQDPKVRATIDKILAYAPLWNSQQQKNWAGLLKFVSEKDRPDIFGGGKDGSETHRLAITGSKPWSDVYINKDRMALPLETWVGILAHEVVHHMGELDGDDRFPDKVGVEIARHFKKNIQTSSLEQFKLPSTTTLVFNSKAKYHTTISFITNGHRTADFGWEPDALVPLCNPNEVVLQQFASAPAWSVNRLDIASGRVVVRGGGYVQTLCENKATRQQRGTTFPINASFGLQFKKPLNLDRWMEEVPTPTYNQEDMFSPSTNPNDALFGQAQTFWIESHRHESGALEAGGVWRTNFILKSLENVAPTSCKMFVAGSQYSYIGQDHLPGINNFDHCTLKNLGGGKWEVSGETRLPDSARPDLYYVPLVLLNSAKVGDRTAVPTIPNFVRLTNKRAPSAPVIKGIKIFGGEPSANLGTLKLTNSSKFKGNQIAKVEFIVEGIPKAYDMWMDFDLWYLLATEFGIARGTGSSESFPQAVRNVVVTPVSEGTKVTFDVQMIENLGNMQIAAIKFRKFYMRTTDYSWVEIEFPELHDHMIVNERYTKPW